MRPTPSMGVQNQREKPQYAPAGMLRISEKSHKTRPTGMFKISEKSHKTTHKDTQNQREKPQNDLQGCPTLKTSSTANNDNCDEKGLRCDYSSPNPNAISPHSKPFATLVQCSSFRSVLCWTCTRYDMSHSNTPAISNSIMSTDL
jgi:hypothetical protein